MEAQGLVMPKMNEKGEQIIFLQEQHGTYETGGHFCAESFEIDVPDSTGWYYENISFPFAICLLAGKAKVLASMSHDEINFHIAPDMTIGAITAPVSAGDTVINVSPTVIGALSVGYNVELDDTNIQNELGRCLNIDAENGQITVETATENSFDPVTPTYVKMTMRMVPKLILVEGHDIELGTSRVGGHYVFPNIPMKLGYNNISGTAKKFTFLLEYLF